MKYEGSSDGTGLSVEVPSPPHSSTITRGNQGIASDHTGNRLTSHTVQGSVVDMGTVKLCPQGEGHNSRALNTSGGGGRDSRTQNTNGVGGRDSRTQNTNAGGGHHSRTHDTNDGAVKLETSEGHAQVTDSARSSLPEADDRFPKESAPTTETPPRRPSATNSADDAPAPGHGGAEEESGSSSGRATPGGATDSSSPPRALPISLPGLLPSTGSVCCGVCQEVCASDKGVRNHMEEQHASAVEACRCDVCSLVFPDKRMLLDHLKFRHEAADFPCQVGWLRTVCVCGGGWWVGECVGDVGGGGCSVHHSAFSWPLRETGQGREDQVNGQGGPG